MPARLAIVINTTKGQSKKASSIDNITRTGGIQAL
jgi:hypothetical protein